MVTGVAESLFRSGLHCLRAPEPALVLAAPREPCTAIRGEGRAHCLRRAVDTLHLGERAVLARLLADRGALPDH